MKETRILRRLFPKKRNRIQYVPFCGFCKGIQELSPDWSILSNIPKNANVILLFGEMKEHKGVRYLVEAEPLIRKEVPEAHVIIAGPGNIEFFRRMVRHEGNGITIINRWLSDEEVAALLKRTDIFVCPYTRWTGTTGVISFAYAFGKPVVATSTGALAEQVEHYKTGLVIPPRDHRALASSIIELLSNSQLRRVLGEHASRKITKSWDTTLASLREIFEKVAE